MNITHCCLLNRVLHTQSDVFLLERLFLKDSLQSVLLVLVVQNCQLPIDDNYGDGIIAETFVG